MTIPSEHQKYVDRFRRAIKDEADINSLLEAEENTDEFLYECIQDALQEINWDGQPVTTFVISDIKFEATAGGVPWVLVKKGATLKFLTGAGIHSARNTFTYGDASGIQVSNADVWGRYINYYNILINKYRDILSKFKLERNINDCYGGVHSEYNNFW